MPLSICCPYSANGPENDDTNPSLITFCADAAPAIAASARTPNRFLVHFPESMMSSKKRRSMGRIRDWAGPVLVTCVPLSFPFHLREYFLGHMERRIRRRNAAVDRGLKQHFLDVVARDAVRERGAHVQLEFFRPIECDHHGKS